jgi:predicted MFS family arabinose efflux permease
VRSFRFQWPSDLLTSLAFEMETLILGWYILVETRSVVLLAVFGSLQFLGTLVAPLFGVMGDRLGRRTTLCGMRAWYAALALVLTLLGLTGQLTPALVFPIAALSGLVRPSDLIMRQSLIGDTMPAGQLMNAMGLSRMTMDIARIAGALAGAGLFAALGFGMSYAFVSGFYLIGFALTLGVTRVPLAGRDPAVPLPSAWGDLKEGLVYVWNSPKVLAIMWLAFLINLSAYPLSNGLLPYVARAIYRVNEIGLSQLVAAFAVGALIGSILMTLTGGARNPTRFMLANVVLWYATLLLFPLIDTKAAGMVLLLFAGLFQSASMITMAVVLLTTVSEQFRARVMGVRILAVYGLPLGLLGSGALIDTIGFNPTIVASGLLGLGVTGLIAYRWRSQLWG